MEIIWWPIYWNIQKPISPFKSEGTGCFFFYYMDDISVAFYIHIIRAHIQNNMRCHFAIRSSFSLYFIGILFQCICMFMHKIKKTTGFCQFLYAYSRAEQRERERAREKQRRKNPNSVTQNTVVTYNGTHDTYYLCTVFLYVYVPNISYIIQKHQQQPKTGRKCVLFLIRLKDQHNIYLYIHYAENKMPYKFLLFIFLLYPCANIRESDGIQTLASCVLVCAPCNIYTEYINILFIEGTANKVDIL